MCFTVLPKNKQYEIGGYIPDSLKMVQGENARHIVGQGLRAGDISHLVKIRDNGKVDIDIPIHNAPELLTNNQMAIIQEPYAFDGRIRGLQ